MATLATDRLNIRPFEMEDARALHAFWSNVDVRRYLWDGIILPIETVRGIIRQSIDDFEAHGFGFFSLDLKVTEPKIVGFCGFRRFEDGRQIELVFGILPEYWGEGFVTEAAREVLRYGFEEAGITRIIAAADTPNQRSVRLLMRLGMSFEARREWHGLDTVFYALTATEFREQ